MLKKYTVSTRTKLELEFRFSTFQKVSLEKYKMSFHLYWLLVRKICCCPKILNLSLTTYLRSFGAAFVKLITKLLFQSLENFIPERCDPFLLDSTPANFFPLKWESIAIYWTLKTLLLQFLIWERNSCQSNAFCTLSTTQNLELL